MKALILIITFGIFNEMFSQNDSILPNVSSDYCIMITSADLTIGSSIQFTNSNVMEDTLSVLYYGDTIATIAIDGNKTYIKRTNTPFDSPYAEFKSEFGNDYEILYDFDLNVGDSAYESYPGLVLTVVSIDSVMIQGVPRKRLNLGNNEYWIQGMGSTRHPLAPKLFYFEHGYYLCSAEMEYFGGSPIDTSTYIGFCDCATIGVEELISENSIKLFPNPSNGEYVKIESDIKISSVIVYDATGKKMHTEFNRFNNYLNVSQLSKGAYIVNVEVEGGAKKIMFIKSI